MVTKGTATLVTGGTLIPPTIDSDSYSSEDPNAISRSDIGAKGGLVRRVGPGDVVVNLPEHAALAESDRWHYRVL